MISVSGVSMRFGSKVLFDEVTTTFSPGRRYGLTGPNGAGKSTFMKLLAGDVQAQKGSVSRPARLGILRQDQFAYDAHRVIDTVIMGNPILWEALAERDRLYAQPSLSDEDGMRLGELEGIIGEHDGYSAESDAAILLAGLDIPDELHERTMAELQGASPDTTADMGIGAWFAPHTHTMAPGTIAGIVTVGDQGETLACESLMPSRLAPALPARVRAHGRPAGMERHRAHRLPRL